MVSWESTQRKVTMKITRGIAAALGTAIVLAGAISGTAFADPTTYDLHWTNHVFTGPNYLNGSAYPITSNAYCTFGDTANLGISNISAPSGWTVALSPAPLGSDPSVETVTITESDSGDWSTDTMHTIEFDYNCTVGV